MVYGAGVAAKPPHQHHKKIPPLRSGEGVGGEGNQVFATLQSRCLKKL